MDSLPVLAHAKLLPSVNAKDLGRTAKRLARSQALLVVRYEEASGELLFFKVPKTITVPDLQHSEASGLGLRGREAHGAPTARRQPCYQIKTGHRRWRGSIQVTEGGRWSASLELPPGDDTALLLTIARKGKGTRLLPNDAALVVPKGEADALLELLSALVARAGGRGAPASRSQRKRLAH